MPNELPAELVRILAYHGAVELRVDPDQGEASAVERASVAPFDDKIIVFLHPRGPVRAGLLRSSVLELQARAPAGEYALRLLGRGWLVGPVARAPDRSALEPWLPEVPQAHQLLIAELTVDHIEMSLGTGEKRQRFFGPTPAAQVRGRRPPRLLRLGFGGAGVLTALLATALPFVYLGVMGADFPGRPAAVVLSAGFGLIGAFAGRHLSLALLWPGYAAGTAELKQVAGLREADTAPHEARERGLALTALWVLGTACITLIWGPTLGAITALANLSWVLVPAAALSSFGGRRPVAPAGADR